MFYIFINKEAPMANISNNNFNKLDLKVSKSEYWDFTLSKQNDPDTIFDGSFFYSDKLISDININDNRCISGNSLYSNTDYKWGDSINNGLILNNFGFNGVDNGTVSFDKDTILPVDFYNLITGSSKSIPSGDTRLIINMVSGNTKDYIYPFSFINDLNGNYIQLEGGFYQGFFKSGDNYSVLPDVIQDEISFEFVLKPDFITIPQPGTLNAKYPNNKGIFFYLGARSENKFWYDYVNKDKNKYSVSKTNEISPLNSISGVTLATDDSFPINSQNIYDIETDNKYLLFSRTRTGQVASFFDNSKEYHITGQTKENINYYPIVNRTKTGYTANNIDSIPDTIKPYEIIDDVISNTIAFRIKDNGSIGYRMINKNCDYDSDYIVDEEYSKNSVIRDNELCFVNVRMLMDSNSECGDSNRTFKLLFYVNGALVFVSKKLPKLILRNLSDRNEKQESIPYNISIGGGSQGLCDMIGFNSGSTIQYLLPIEQYFAGSLVGNIHQFKVYYGKMDYSKIKNNYIYQTGHLFSPGYIMPTIGFYISGVTISEPETTYKREIGNTNTILNATVILNYVYSPITGYKLYYYPDSSNGTQINGLFNLSPSGGTIPEYTHNDSSVSSNRLTSLKYVIEVFDSYNMETGTKEVQEIKFDNMIFYGDTSGVTISPSDIRLLKNRLFNIGTDSFVFETGYRNRVFVIAIPSDRLIVNVVDQNLITIDITRLFVKTEINVPDAGDILTPYNIYIMENAIPYNSNHNFIVTLN